jgi:LacI family transcriptional regulator
MGAEIGKTGLASKTHSKRSIYDLADQVGVSASTVSRVLNGRRGIGEETRDLVLRAARASGFRPRMAARPLTVAVVIDRNQYAAFGGFISSVLSHIVQTLTRHDVAVKLITEHSLKRLRDRLVDGILALAWDDATIAELRKMPDVPVVTINRVEPDFSAVVTNHRLQGETVVDYFHQRGHRRFAMICEERNNWGSLQRIAGFTDALAQRGIHVGNEAIVSMDHQPMYGVLRRLMVDCSPTALYIAGEDLTLEVCYILRNVLDLKLAHDVSVLGMESAKISQFMAPPITTLSQPLEELARLSIEVLQRQMAGDRQPPERLVLDCSLIERESVATFQSGDQRWVAAG